MSVDISPAELSFRRPFTREEVSQVLKISNPNPTPIAFKVKTTAPKQYCVRPNSGRIEPGHDVEVTVALQVMKTEPAPDAKCRDKFLVQAVIISSDKEFANVASILDTADKTLVQERKIRVNWLSADGEPAPSASMTPNRHSVANMDHTPDVRYKDPSEDSAAPPPYNAFDSKSRNEDTSSEKPAPVTPPSFAAGVPVVEEIKRHISESETASGLRHRGEKVAHKAANTVGTTAQQARDVVGGVPVQVVAALCLVSFLLAYFFF
jgi:hypothetical protein